MTFQQIRPCVFVGLFDKKKAKGQNIPWIKISNRNGKRFAEYQIKNLIYSNVILDFLKGSFPASFVMYSWVTYISCISSI